MQGYVLIGGASIGLFIAGLLGLFDITTGYSFLASFFFMSWILGSFDKEKAARKGTQQNSEEGDNERLAEFKRKMAQGKEDAKKEVARVHIVDENGNHSSVVISPNGDIEVEGKVSPEIIQAAQSLRDSIQMFGVDAVATELQRRIDIYYAELKKENENDKE